MEEHLLRVIVSRRGKIRPTEFRLRDGEVGLSLFRQVQRPDSTAIIEAVLAAGKRGELTVVEIPVAAIRELGLRIVPTPGGTTDPAVNAIHVEVRPSRWQWLSLRLRGRKVHDWFNEAITPHLAVSARFVE